jgi:hypothetical protein
MAVGVPEETPPRQKISVAASFLILAERGGFFFAAADAQGQW